MRPNPTIYLVPLALLAATSCHASLDRFLPRRQSGEAEQESTTPKSQPASGQQQTPGTGANGAPQGRLYPDLAQRPGVNFLPPFNAQPNHGAMPAFVPFNMPNRLNSDQQGPGPFGPRMLPPPRPMSPTERLQSQSFSNGLGKRLLSLIGVDAGGKNSTNDNGATVRSDGPMQQFQPLQNSTVLLELNNRLGMVMGGLSKMYNSTVQEQLGLLQQRFKTEVDNSTNPWAQRMAQQVPMFFEQMAGKVSAAQNQLNRVWRDMVQASQGNTTVLDRAQNPNNQAGFFSSVDQFMNPAGGSFFGNNQNGGDFVNQISRSFGFGPSEQAPANGSTDMAARLREFWHVQVQPQIGMLRNQMARVWRDLSTSGALMPQSISRRVQPQDAANNNNNNNNSEKQNELVDSILKEADTDSAEFALIAPKSDPSSAQPEKPNDKQTSGGMPQISPHMQQRLMMMQRDLNQLWQGLSSSLQNAMNNAKATLNPRPSFGPINPNQSPVEPDPAQNEINVKVQDLSKLQKEADAVYDTVQQRQREAQQRQTIADKFRGFLGNVDLNGLNQLPDRIGDQVSRFGASLGNFWNTIPERWDNMMAQRQNQANQARLQAQVNAKTSTTTPASPAENSVM